MLYGCAFGWRMFIGENRIRDWALQIRYLFIAGVRMLEFTKDDDDSK